MWQDTALSITVGFFVVSLIPTILDPYKKPPVITGVLTMIPMAINSAVFMTLGMWWTAFATAINCLEWAVITVQRYRLDRTSR